MNNFQNLSDKELYLICKRWGAEALNARRKFAGLLPEVYARETAVREKGGSWLKKRGFSCIYEFAAKLGGLSREQVDLVLRLEKRFEKKPVLRDALVSGEVSANKLARIASIANMENQNDLLGKVENLSSRALEVYVKDVKNQNGFSEPKNISENVHVQTFETEKNSENNIENDLGLDEDIQNELLEMKKKGININAILREFLQQRKQNIEKEKSALADEQREKRETRAVIGIPANRYIPASVRGIIIKEFGTRCSALGCERQAENFHHEKIFSISQCHDPHYIKPLCVGHHELAHID